MILIKKNFFKGGHIISVNIFIHTMFKQSYKKNKKLLPQI